MIEVLERPSPDWDDFVRVTEQASLYHASGWAQMVREVFGHEIRFLEARGNSGQLEGVLPLVQQKRALLGNFATSMPYFNYGGALATSETVAVELMVRAKQIARSWNCSYIEFRDTRPRDGGWIVRTDKVSMVLDLPASRESLATRLGSKLRSQIKRADRESPAVKIGKKDLLDDFYEVFCRNMHELGTPTYPKRFFAAIIDRFPEGSMIISIEKGGAPAAAAFLQVDKGRAEVPWACCRADAKPLGFNMKLYWEILGAAIGMGCTQFDFGRSTVDSGTYRFKKQWGAQPVQLYWHRWHANGQPTVGSAGRKASAIWRRLPLSVANALGPLISPGLPW